MIQIRLVVAERRRQGFGPVAAQCMDFGALFEPEPGDPLADIAVTDDRYDIQGFSPA